MFTLSLANTAQTFVLNVSNQANSPLNGLKGKFIKSPSTFKALQTLLSSKLAKSTDDKDLDTEISDFYSIYTQLIDDKMKGYTLNKEDLFVGEFLTDPQSYEEYPEEVRDYLIGKGTFNSFLVDLIMFGEDSDSIIMDSYADTMSNPMFWEERFNDAMDPEQHMSVKDKLKLVVSFALFFTLFLNLLSSFERYNPACRPKYIREDDRLDYEQVKLYRCLMDLKKTKPFLTAIRYITFMIKQTLKQDESLLPLLDDESSFVRIILEIASLYAGLSKKIKEVNQTNGLNIYETVYKKLVNLGY